MAYQATEKRRLHLLLRMQEELCENILVDKCSSDVLVGSGARQLNVGLAPISKSKLPAWNCRSAIWISSSCATESELFQGNSELTPAG